METKTKIISLLAFAALVGVVIYLVVNHLVFAQRPVLLALQVVAVALMIWARTTFGRRSFHAGADPTEGGLVTTGPYRYLRHPIYAAILLFVGATLVDHASALHLVLIAVVFAAALARALSEEKLVRLRYPEYDAYAQRTKRFVPFVW